jgi:hypothetical protein
MNEDVLGCTLVVEAKIIFPREWIDKTTEFLDHAFAKGTGHSGVMCPCN